MSAPSDPPPPPHPASRPQSATQEIPMVPPSSAPPPTGAQPPAAPDGPLPTGPVDFVPGLPAAGAPQAPAAPVLPPPGTAPPVPVAPQPVPSEPPPVGSVPTAAASDTPTTASDSPAATTIWPQSLDDEPAGGTKKHRRLSVPSGRGKSRPRDPKALLGLGLVTLALVLLEVGLLVEFGSRSYWSAVTLWSAFATLCVLLALLAFAAFYPAGNRLRSGPAWRVAAGGLVGLAAFWLLVVLPEVASDRGFVLTAALAALGAALWIGPRRKD